MEYNNNNNNNNNNQSNERDDSLGTTLRPIGYFYTTTFTLSPTFIDTLLSLNNQENIMQNNSTSSEQSNNFESEISDNSNFSNSNLYYNPIIFNSSNLRLFDINENNEEAYYDSFFPTVNFIESIFNDYIENKNKLNDVEYKKNVERIHEKLEECPVCFNSDETTIKIKKCNHMFCEDCIQKWLKSHKNTCPICRVNVIIEPENGNGNGNGNINTNNENSNE